MLGLTCSSGLGSETALTVQPRRRRTQRPIAGQEERALAAAREQALASQLAKAEARASAGLGASVR